MRRRPRLPEPPRRRGIMRRAHPATDIRALARTEQLILRLLREHGETYGLRLVALSGGEITQGGVYVTLGRMVEKGYVESWIALLPGFTGPPRRLYRPTAHGLRMLEAQEAFAAAVGGRGANGG